MGTSTLGPCRSGRPTITSTVVGALHGLAGSGSLVVLLVASSPTLDAALGFLSGFCLLSIVTMGTVATVWGRTLGTGRSIYLEAAAGLLGVGIGGVLVVEQVVSPALGALPASVPL